MLKKIVIKIILIKILLRWPKISNCLSKIDYYHCNLNLWLNYLILSKYMIKNNKIKIKIDSIIKMENHSLNNVDYWNV
jgi:hypothetical protein